MVTESFEHQLLSLEYPKNWKKSDEDMILAISKFTKMTAVAEEENPSLVIVADDSTSLLAYGVTSFEDFLIGFKQTQLSKSHIELVEDFTTININGSEINLIKYKVKNQGHSLLQSQYSFRSLNHYVCLITTQNFGKHNDELQTILSTLKIPKQESIQKLFEQE
ncbi:hypothetical protein GCM10011506_46510 [Marivirga lumbricoides]|uniref:Uncharacterized protein n=1 Tax=Marivirga lumbricoides TaxID=1046115 RepID=A0ABQ1N6K0_9BACT|nr:hypothetical protein GCM10011506_46510 [Marivirga lumbricoides]